MIQKLQQFFVRVVDRVEENPTPLPRYFGLFFALLAVRLCLEFFSSHRLFTLTDVMHIGLWFVFIVLAFLLQLHLFSGVSITRVTKLVVVCFSIALTAPIIDLILNGGVGAKMNYLSIASWQDAVFSYFTVGGASLSRGATLGIRIEIVLLVIASFNYVRTKRNSIIWGLISAVSIYTVLFISGTVPKLLGWLVDGLGLKYGTDDQSTLLLLLCLDLILLGIALWRYAPFTFRQLVRIGFSLKRLPALFLFIWGARLAFHHYPDLWKLNPTTFFWFPILVILGIVLVAFAGLQQYTASVPEQARHMARKRIFLILTALVLGLSIGEKAVFMVGVILAIHILLNEPPLHLAKFPLTRNLLESMLLTGFGLLGFVIFGGPMVGFPHRELLVILLVQIVATSYPLLFWKPYDPQTAKGWEIFPHKLNRGSGPVLIRRIVNQIMIGGAMVLGAYLLARNEVGMWIGVGTGVLMVPALWLGVGELIWLLVYVAYGILALGG